MGTSGCSTSFGPWGWGLSGSGEGEGGVMAKDSLHLTLTMVWGTGREQPPLFSQSPEAEQREHWGKPPAPFPSWAVLDLGKWQGAGLAAAHLSQASLEEEGSNKAKPLSIPSPGTLIWGAGREQWAGALLYSWSQGMEQTKQGGTPPPTHQTGDSSLGSGQNTAESCSSSSLLVYGKAGSRCRVPSLDWSLSLVQGSI